MIIWKEQHRESVATQYLQLCRERDLDPVKHWGQANTLVDAQVLALPENLWRGKASLSGEKNQRPIVDKVYKLLAAEKDAQDEAQRLAAETQRLAAEETERQRLQSEAREKEEEHAEALRKAASPYKQSIVEAAESKPGDVGRDLPSAPKKIEFREVPDDHFGESIESMIQNLATGIASVVVDQIIAQTKQAFLRELPKLATRALTMSKTLPKILVVGPLPKFQSQLEQAVDGVAELKFVSQEEGASLVTLRGKSCVAAIIWTNFISHSHQNAVKKLFTDNNSRYITGGFDTLKAAIEEVVIQLPEGA
jgi:hypothetical protein